MRSSTAKLDVNPHRRLASILGIIGFAAAATFVAAAETSTPVAVSPNGQIRIEVALDPPSDGAPKYQISFRGKPVVLPSRLQIEMTNSPNLGSKTSIENIATRQIDETYTQFPGKRSKVTNRCQETTVTFREGGEPALRWEVVLRAYDDGAALRYRFPKQEGWKSLAIAAEHTEFRLPDDATAETLPLQNFTTSHEAHYKRMAVKAVPPNQLLGLPLLAELPNTGWVAIAEANLTDYAGLYLARTGDTAPLVSRLSPRPGDPNVAVRAELPHDSPWRVFLIADHPGRLVESDLVLNLNAPLALDDISWIQPGLTTFPWWNSFYEENPPVEMGLNTATAKYYIDFCAEAGIPYHSLDGVKNDAWYGGRVVPYDGSDITKGNPNLDLREVIRYAASKGVKIRLWMHWQAAQAQMDTAFPLYKEWGVEGVMLDFMNRDDQEMVNFLRRVLVTAAANHLTVTLHGVSAPTGLERTFPHLLTHEGVMNLEYDKWDKNGITPDYETTVPFTRMLAGPLDFHQGSLRGVPQAEFLPRDANPLVIGTPCRMLASYVVLQNHLPMAADYPSAYRGNPALPVLVSIPATWDETRCLVGEVGKFIVIARRSGKDWWVGAMAGVVARDLKIPLDFLGPGSFTAEIYSDDRNADHGFAHRSETVSSTDALDASLAPAGGHVIRLTPTSDN